MARVADFAFFGEWNRDGGTPEKMIIVKKTELLAQEQDPRYMPQMQEINNPWEETRKKLKLDEQSKFHVPAAKPRELTPMQKHWRPSTIISKH